MVLLYGIPGDGPFEMIADALEDLGKNYRIINQRRFAEIDLVLNLDADGVAGEISIGSESYHLKDIAGIYNRAFDFSMIPEAKDFKGNIGYSRQYANLFDTINQWIEIASCRVVNKGSAMSSNSSKPYQLALIRPFFEIPETLITNQTSSVKTFYHSVTEVIYKSASSVRSIVQAIKPDDDVDWNKIRNCPTLFQERLLGVNYRVHVIGDKVFATRADSVTIDYRYSNREGQTTAYSAAVLPGNIEDKCIRLARQLKLPFAGIDLFLTQDERWYCFEVNASPGFSFFENHTGQPIARAVAQYLSGMDS